VRVAHAFIVANGTGASSVTVSDTRGGQAPTPDLQGRNTFVTKTSRFRVRV